MTETKKKLKEYWDKLISDKIPPHAHFHKIEEELKEHFSLMRLAWKRFLLPIIAFYLLAALIFHINVLSSLFISLMIFVYSNVLPDLDVLIQKPPENQRESLWYEIYFLLFFAPIFLYYVINGKAGALYSKKHRPFHNLKAVLLWGIFLFTVGSLFWPNETFNKTMLPVFGIAGYIFHLGVDGIMKFFKIGVLISDRGNSISKNKE